MRTIQTSADCGAIMVYTADASFLFNAGSGDGNYSVVICGRNEVDCSQAEFVDSFTVKTSATLSTDDCEEGEAFVFLPGRYFVSHIRDDRKVIIEKMD